MTTPLLTEPPKPFDQSAQGQAAQQTPAHDPAAPRGETTLSTAGKVVAGALLGTLAWFGWKAYGWAQPKPGTKGKRR